MGRAQAALAAEALNKSQRTAVQQALTGTLTLWQVRVDYLQEL